MIVEYLEYVDKNEKNYSSSILIITMTLLNSRLNVNNAMSPNKSSKSHDKASYNARKMKDLCHREFEVFMSTFKKVTVILGEKRGKSRNE